MVRRESGWRSWLSGRRRLQAPVPGELPLSRKRAALFATACFVPLLASGGAAPQQRPSTPAAGAPAPRPAARSQPVRLGDTISDIKVVGNARIEAGTVRSYMLVQPGDPFDPDRIDRSLKTLYATGLFHDVNLTRQGNTLVVTVVENPLVNQVAFEGNHSIVDATLRPMLDLRARSVFTPELAQSDRQKILDAYAKKGRFGATVTPKIIKLGQNRVDVVFEIHDGPETLVSRIAFVGNHAFSEGQLREVVSSRQEAFWRFLSNSDTYNPERVDYDKELLRRFYLKNGYADFDVRDATAELAPDRSAFFLTFTLNEGERYTVGSVSVDSKLHNLDGKVLLPLVQQQVGDVYDGDAVERSTSAIEDAVQNRGYAFVEVHPRIARNTAKHTVDLVFDVSQGPRVYVERIDIQGNTRTKDNVIRREMQLAEGDAFNAAAIRRSRQRLEDLGYFNTATVTSSPGSTSDKAVVAVNVDEKATGELSFGGGFSTDEGALLNAGLREKNLIGTGIDANLNGVLAQRGSQIDFSLTDPYLFDRNLVGGVDVFDINNNNQNISDYDESRVGFTLRLGYEFNAHLRQALNYSLVDRTINNVGTDASIFILDSQGTSLLSQVGQTLTLDYRDSRSAPHTGFIVNYGLDFAGIGGSEKYVRNKIDGTYYIPLDEFSGNSDWGISVSAGTGYLSDFGGGKDQIIDRFFLGGDNLRGFESGGAGPHTQSVAEGGVFYGSDSVGGRFIYTQSTELHFPLPISPDLGLSGRAFVDVGGLSNVSQIGAVQAPNVFGVPQTVNQQVIEQAGTRVGAGVGVSWKTPFGLINIDVADPVVKKSLDQTQVFRFGFGTRF
jgi:outer membrane protein insertion porin family